MDDPNVDDPSRVQPVDRRQALGRAGEAATAAWYEANDYSILDQNWRVRKGEIDIVAQQGDVVVFCEVKTRSSNRFGSGAEAVDQRKQQQVRDLARRWLTTSERRYREVRFDVADVSLGDDGEPLVNVITGCF